MYVYILQDISKLKTLEILELAGNNLNLWPLGLLYYHLVLSWWFLMSMINFTFSIFIRVWWICMAVQFTSSCVERKQIG